MVTLEPTQVSLGEGQPKSYGTRVPTAGSPKPVDLGVLCGGRKPAVFTFHILKKCYTVLQTFSLKPTRWATSVVGEPSRLELTRDSAYPGTSAGSARSCPA